MTGYLAGALYTGGALVTSYAARRGYNAYKAYFSPESYEDQYLRSTTEAFDEIKRILTPLLTEMGFSDEMIELECSDFSHVMNVIEFFKDIVRPLDEAAVNKFTRALEKYQTNIDQFEKYSARSSEENLLSVKEELGEERGDKAKLSARAHHFESSIIREGLSKEDTSEEGAYARVLDTRKKFRLAIQMAKPEVDFTSSTVDEYLSNLDTIRTNSNLTSVIKSRAQAYQAALRQHKGMASIWSSEQRQSTRVLLSSIKSDDEGSENLQLKGRIEYLEQRVKLLDECVVTKFNECFGDYRDHVTEALTGLQGRLEAIDPGLVGKSRFGSSGWNPFALIANIISSWWNKDTVMDLQDKCSLLQTELDKSEPSTEEEYGTWISSKPLTDIDPQEQSRIDDLRQSFVETATPHIKSGETLAQVAVKKDYDEQELLKIQYSKLKAACPGLRDKAGETFTFDNGSLRVEGEGFTVHIGSDIPWRAFQGDIFLKMILGTGGDGGETLDYIRQKMFSPNVAALIIWGNGESEIFYDKPQEGSVPPNGVKEGGNKDFEYSKFVTGRSIKYKLDQESGLIEFDGEGIRLGLSMQDYSKPLAGLPEGFIKSSIKNLLNTVYRDGLQLTLNLKKIGCVVDDRDGRTKVKAFYEINDQNPVELERGSKLNSLLKRQLADGIELFVDIDEFRNTFDNLAWT